jgi:hypothetical protein
MSMLFLDHFMFFPAVLLSKVKYSSMYRNIDTTIHRNCVLLFPPELNEEAWSWDIHT